MLCIRLVRLGGNIYINSKVPLISPLDIKKSAVCVQQLSLLSCSAGGDSFDSSWKEAVPQSVGGGADIPVPLS